METKTKFLLIEPTISCSEKGSQNDTCLQKAVVKATVTNLEEVKYQKKLDDAKKRFQEATQNLAW
tara:strand:+ start:751 stop:945 length:195 start_codon:yes stop_codon:yes gene_type:complete